MMFWRLVGLFFLLNIADGAMTHYLVAKNYQVEESNGLMSFIVSGFGWTGFWIYKTLLPVLIGGLVYTVFSPTKSTRIMRVTVIVFSLFMIYMIGLSAVALIGDYRYAS